jgi:ribosome-associated translation inhibitor RaiA
MAADTVNYKVFIREKLNEFHAKLPDYTFSQVILAVLKCTDNFQTFQKSDLLSITDEDFYTAIENALKKENDKNLRYA